MYLLRSLIMSHTSTSKDCYLKDLCRKVAVHKFKDGREVFGSIVREEKALNKKLHVLASEEQRFLNKLDNQIKDLKNRQSLPDVSRGGLDQNNDTSERRTRASTMHALDREVGRHANLDLKPETTRKATTDSCPALSRLSSSPLLQKRLCKLKKESPLCLSVPELFNLNTEITRILTQLPTNKEAKGTERGNLCGPRLGGSLPPLTTKNESSRSPHIRRNRSASLHDAMFASSLQDLRDVRPDSRQRTRASSLLSLNDSSSQCTVNGGVDHASASRYGRLPVSPLANRKRITNSSCSCHKSADDLNKNDTALCQTENGLNSAEALSRCRYLRIPSTNTNDDGSE